VRFLSPAKHRSVDDIASRPACGFSSWRPDCVAGVVGLEVRRETGKE
jgi:hypothetical protein